MTCRGHPNIQLTHETTLEFSPDNYLGIRGDCILCIELATHLYIPDLSVCQANQNRKTRVMLEIFIVPPPWSNIEIQKINIICENLCDPEGFVLRKSTYCDKRTLAIGCDKSAAELRVLEHLKAAVSDPFTKIYVSVKLD